MQEIVDFEKLEEEKWKEGNWDVVFITCALAVLFFSLPGKGSRVTKVSWAWFHNFQNGDVEEESRLSRCV